MITGVSSLPSVQAAWDVSALSNYLSPCKHHREEQRERGGGSRGVVLASPFLCCWGQPSVLRDLRDRTPSFPALGPWPLSLAGTACAEWPPFLPCSEFLGDTICPSLFDTFGKEHTSLLSECIKIGSVSPGSECGAAPQAEWPQAAVLGLLFLIFLPHTSCQAVSCHL